MEADEPARDAVRQAMPELGAALDRQAEVVKVPARKRRPRWLLAPGQRPRAVPWQESEGSGR